MAENRLIDVTGHVGGTREVSILMGKAPAVIRGQVIYGFKKERDSFVGKKRGAPGVFRKSLERKKLWGGRTGIRGGRDTWSPQVSALFRGKVTASRGKTLGDVVLGMGHFYNNPKQIHAALDFLAHGGTITSSGEMIIPVYENLNRVGFKVKTGMSGGAMKRYSEEHGLVRVPAGGVAYYYDREMVKRSGYFQSMMFIGVHRITVKQQFDFKGDWKRREPKVIERLRKQVSRAVEKINKGELGETL